MKKNVVKKLLTGVLAGVMCFSMAACGSKAGSASESVGKDTAKAQGADYAGKTLSIGIWGGNESESAALDKMKDTFEEMTGCTVDFKVYTDYNTQVQADFIGKTAPDVFYTESSVFPFYSSLGVLEPLDESEMEADKFYDNLIEAFTDEDGTLYCLPKDVSTLAMYYNEEMLEACGYTVADIPEDLEDFVTFLPEFQKKLDEVYGKDKVAAMTYNQDLARNLHLLERDGGEISKEDGTSTLSNDKVVKNLEFILSLVDTGAYKTPEDLGLGWNGEVFGTGKCAIMEEGNWVYGNLKNEYPDVKFGVKDMPAYKGEKSSMSFTVGYGIFSASDNKELAKEWIKYACGTDGMYTWTSEAGCLPSRGDVAEALDVQSDPVLAVHMAQEEYAVPWQQGKTLFIINDNYKNFLPEAVKHKISAKEAMKKVDQQSNSEIENAG